MGESVRLLICNGEMIKVFSLLMMVSALLLSSALTLTRADGTPAAFPSNFERQLTGNIFDQKSSEKVVGFEQKTGFLQGDPIFATFGLAGQVKQATETGGDELGDPIRVREEVNGTSSDSNNITTTNGTILTDTLAEIEAADNNSTESFEEISNVTDTSNNSATDGSDDGASLGNETQASNSTTSNGTLNETEIPDDGTTAEEQTTLTPTTPANQTATATHRYRHWPT